MKLPATMRTRQGAFGILVVTVVPAATPHILLPLSDNQPLVQWVFSTAEQSVGHRHVFTEAPPLVAEPAGPDELRAEKEREASARGNYQPFGWGTRTYQSVSGVRWVCCGNPFDEAHSPWCSEGGFLDPLPPA